MARLISSVFLLFSLVLLFNSVSALYFEPVTYNQTELTVNEVPRSVEASFGDYNNDKYQDILVTIGVYFPTSTNTGYARVLTNNAGTGLTQDDEGIFQYNGTVAAWFDFNNDCNLDIIVGGSMIAAVQDCGTNPPPIRIYEGDGEGNFTLAFTFTNMVKGCYPDVYFCDFNSDGFTDLFFTVMEHGGSTFLNGTVHLVENLRGAGFAEVANPGFPGDLTIASAAWGDYDNDGFDDVLLSGSTLYPFGNYSALFRNVNGTGQFEHLDVNDQFLGGVFGSIQWADFNSDGFLDVVANELVFYGGASEIQTTLLINNGGTGSFTYHNATYTGLPLLEVASIAVGDFNNDNLPDVVLSGQPVTATAASGVYQNGDGTHFTKVFSNFTLSILGGLPFPLGSVYVGEFDNDGRLDMLELPFGGYTTLYLNKNPTAGSAPSPPTDVSATWEGSDLRIEWTPPTGGSGSYTYNVDISDGGLSGLAHADGTRKVAAHGNAGVRTFSLIKGVTVQEPFTVSVQTIDAAYRGSAWTSVTVGGSSASCLSSWLSWVSPLF